MTARSAASSVMGVSHRHCLDDSDGPLRPVSVACRAGTPQACSKASRWSMIDVGDATLRVRHGGSGPPLLLLHGHPRTHVTWHRVAPLLANDHTVVCPDLRGYGQSSKPPTTADHAPYSKRAMAADCIALMRALGHDAFAVAGHDRGCYVAARTALDHPDAVTHLGVLDGIPIVEALERCDARFAALWWHWWFLGQTDKPAERVISADPDAWYTAGPEQMGDEAHADFRAAIHDPATVHAMCEDYRAGLTVDRAARRGRPRRRPPGRVPHALLLVDPRRHGGAVRRSTVAIWRTWADDIGRGRDRQRPPHGRGGARRAGRCAADLAGALIAATTPRSARRPPDRRRRSRSRRSARPSRTGTRATAATPARGGRAWPG